MLQLIGKYINNFLIYVLIIAILLILNSCAKNIATGGRQLVILSTEEENNIGAKEHPNIIRSFGGIKLQKVNGSEEEMEAEILE